MKPRVKKARRILALQKQLHRKEEWKLAEFDRQHAQLTAAQGEIITALNENQALHGLFIDAAARRLRSLAQEAERVACQRRLQAEKLIARAAQLKCAERLSLRLEQETRRESRQRELMDILERCVWASRSPRR